MAKSSKKPRTAVPWDEAAAQPEAGGTLVAPVPAPRGGAGDADTAPRGRTTPARRDETQVTPGEILEDLEPRKGPDETLNERGERPRGRPGPPVADLAERSEGLRPGRASRPDAKALGAAARSPAPPPEDTQPRRVSRPSEAAERPPKRPTRGEMPAVPEPAPRARSRAGSPAFADPSQRPGGEAGGVTAPLRAPGTFETAPMTPPREAPPKKPNRGEMPAVPELSPRVRSRPDVKAPPPRRVSRPELAAAPAPRATRDAMPAVGIPSQETRITLAPEPAPRSRPGPPVEDAEPPARPRATRDALPAAGGAGPRRLSREELPALPRRAPIDRGEAPSRVEDQPTGIGPAPAPRAPSDRGEAAGRVEDQPTGIGPAPAPRAPSDRGEAAGRVEDQPTGIGPAPQPRPGPGRAPPADEPTGLREVPARPGAFSRGGAARPELEPEPEPERKGLTHSLTSLRMDVGNRRFAGFVALCALVVGATLVLGFRMALDVRPDIAELRDVYPYGFDGARGTLGELAPGAAQVEFAYDAEVPCTSHTRCLRYRFSSGAFEGSMIVGRSAEGRWSRVSDEGLPFRPVR